MSERKDGLPKAPRKDGERRRKQIIAIVRENPGIGLRELAREAGAAVSTVEYQVIRMVKDGVLKRQTNSRNRRPLFVRE